MIKIILRDGLPFTEVILRHKNKAVTISNVLIDTGSVSTIVSTDIALIFGLKPEHDDRIHAICGVGGTEYVYEKEVETIEIGQSIASKHKTQIGAMDYGFEINMIIGMDLLMKLSATVDLGKMTLTVG